MATPQPGNPVRWTARLASVALASVALVAVGPSAPYPVSIQAYRTQVGGTERVELADGTVVELNTHTALRTRFSHSTRHVELLHGEAFFSVSQDAARPFVVRAGQTQVQVVGTTFSVRKVDSTTVSVVVSGGRVSMRHAHPWYRLPFDALDGAPERGLLLSAGDAAVDANGTIVRESLNPTALDARLAWRTGALVVMNQPLSEVVAELNRYNTAQLRIADPAIASFPISGRLDARDVEEFLLSLRVIHPGIRVVRRPGVNGQPEVIELYGKR